MCDGYVLKTPRGDEICIPIYVEVDRFPHRPDPEAKWYGDLVSLVTIDQLAGRIQDAGVKSHISDAIQSAAQSIEQSLPEGVSLGNGLFANRRAAPAS